MQQQGPTSGEKGLALEQRIARLFEARGYEVSHDVWLTGRSGAQHQIDVLARFAAPLHTSTIIIEAKAYQGSVDKDRIMKLIQIVDDLGCDRGILVTTSSFTPDAVKTAQGRNVDVWDRDRLARLMGELEVAAVEGGTRRAVQVLERSIAPRIDAEALRQQLEQDVKKRGRGVLGIGKVVEELAELRRVAYPYYDAEIELEVADTQKVGLFKRETIRKTLATSVTFDAVSGSLVRVAPTNVDYSPSWLSVLAPDEVRLLRTAGGRAFRLAALVALGLSEAKSKRVVASLLGKGLVRQTEVRPATYQAVRLFPDVPEALTALTDVHEICEDAGRGNAVVVPAGSEPNAVVSAVELYWDARVNQLRTVYYPYFYAIYRREGGSIRVDAIDAVTGAVNDAVSANVQARVVTNT